ncbi:AAA family ATPase [Vibrio splendidus]|uniref:AAA family ATPase n=1 Tax=Vibrio splendidus TaxID=29497 RepID=A0ABD5AEX5_VIBSP|nr:AAA family ATPase [Vibrio splendidus]MDP2491585.1 AAA family ATPase [Vibrio splendidus]PMO51668.1 hypothetical protein BCT08_22345 [Vibrio splendidus]
MIKSLEEYKADISDVVDRIKFDSDSNGNSENFEFQSGYGDWDLADVQKFNFFVGANNSGKSRVLRYILKHKVLSWDIDTDLLPVKSVVRNLDNKGISNMGLQYTNDTSALASSIARLKASPPDVGIAKIAKAIVELLDVNRMAHVHDVTADKIYKFVVMDKLPAQDASFITNEFKIQFADSVYIPTLRTLRHISDDDLYHKRTVADYFKEGGIKQQDIFTGHDIAKDLKRHLLGTHKQREKVRHFEQFLSEKFFYGADISLTPRIDDNVVWFKEGVKDEYPIYDLGDGIQAIIILTYKVFMAEQPTVFFIEEPEKYLHAGMQRTLIEALADVPHHMFFMTTHSNHFLDLALERNDVATHQVSQHEGKTLTRSSAELTDLLDGLGVRASSVLLANCSIWIEGVTDKLYLRTYMNKFLKELEDKDTNPERVARLKSYHENLHFVFVEYQGSNITHWAFNHDESGDETTSAYLLNNKIFLLADGDIDWKGDRTENLTDHLGEQFYQLELKEIENYIPLEVIKKTAELRLNVMNQKKGCSLNFDSFTQGSYAKKKVGIGRYLEQCVEKPEGLEKSFFEEVRKSNTGTIRDKVTFCKEAVRYMNGHPEEWMLTDDLTELCDKLWCHVESSN